MIAGADLIDDDLPANLDYLNQASRNTTQGFSASRATGESLGSWQVDDADDRLATEINGDTIRILMKDPFEMAENYWNSLSIVDDEFADAWVAIEAKQNLAYNQQQYSHWQDSRTSSQLQYRHLSAQRIRLAAYSQNYRRRNQSRSTPP